MSSSLPVSWSPPRSAPVCGAAHTAPSGLPRALVRFFDAFVCSLYAPCPLGQNQRLAKWYRFTVPLYVISMVATARAMPTQATPALAMALVWAPVAVLLWLYPAQATAMTRLGAYLSVVPFLAHIGVAAGALDAGPAELFWTLYELCVAIIAFYSLFEFRFARILSAIYTVASISVACAVAVAHGHGAGASSSLVRFSAGALVMVGLTVVLSRVYAQHQSLSASTDQLRRNALTDELTAIPNRRAFQAQLRRSVAHATRRDQRLSLVLLDLDHFKAVNDTHGHQAGDRVLQALAKTVQAGLRSTDFLARWGGEEFAVLMPDTSGHRATGVARRLCRLVEGSPSDVGPVTASFGVAELHVGREDGASFVERCDAALYRAKHEGRNRVAQALPWMGDSLAPPAAERRADSGFAA